jgi:hypothetical protein
VFSLFAKTMRAKRGLLEDGGAELAEVRRDSLAHRFCLYDHRCP